MIRTIIIEDDPIITGQLVSYLRRIPAFEPAGSARTGRDGRELAARSGPDLVLLDLTLPDMTGFEVWKYLRDLPSPPDVIAATGAGESATIRRAVSSGAISYLVKPFSFAIFRDKLEGYASYARRLPAGVTADQRQIDDALDATHRPGGGGLPKGLSEVTMEEIIRVLRGAGEPLSAAEVGRPVRRSRVVAARYLDYLYRQGQVRLTYSCGGTGRPVHLYRLIRPSPDRREPGSTGGRPEG